MTLQGGQIPSTLPPVLSTENLVQQANWRGLLIDSKGVTQPRARRGFEIQMGDYTARNPFLPRSLQSAFNILLCI